MKADLIEMNCQHFQADGSKTYKAVCVEDGASLFYLRAPMSQYYLNKDVTEKVLAEIVERINK